MRYLLLPLLLLAGCVGPYDPYYGYGYGPGYDAGPYPQYASSYPGHGYGASPYYSDRGSYGSENCGTPDQWKACPRRWR